MQTLIDGLKGTDRLYSAGGFRPEGTQGPTFRLVDTGLMLIGEDPQTAMAVMLDPNSIKESHRGRLEHVIGKGIDCSIRPGTDGQSLVLCFRSDGLPWRN